jgi:DNA mismatch repair protein MutS2
LERETLKQELSIAGQERNEASTLLRTAQDEARAVKSKAQQESRDVVAALRQKLRELSRAPALEREEQKKATSDIEALADKLNSGPPKQERNSGNIHEYSAGDRVRIQSVNKIGTVLSSQRGIIEIELGNKTIKVSAGEVALVGPVLHAQKIHTAPGWGADLHENEGAPDRLNILGLRVEEGLAEVDRFIDHASTRGLSIVTIIHGLGTGALKKAVMEFMKNHPLIAAIRPGEAAEGGAGVTVAELKK